MTRSTFGNTWWGEQWLAALAHIDFDNRLPRGRSYANKGAVRNLVVKDSTIQAQVQGSHLYRVAITVPAMAPKDATRLLDRIAADPILIARLLNLELDPDLLGLAEDLNIAIFPRRWRDLDMHCSCPDWAVPCKHLAATIYLLSREIDGNPFLVFSLRGLDLVAELKSRGVHIGSRASVILPSLVDLLTTGDPHEMADATLLTSLDFSLIPDLAAPLAQVLPANPSFFPVGNLQNIYRRLLTRIAKSSQKALAWVDDAQTDLLSAHDRPILILDAKHGVKLTGTEACSEWSDWITALGQLTPADLADFQPEVSCFHTLNLLALHLLVQGAVVPQIFTLTNQDVGLRWLPAHLDPVVNEIMRQVSRGLPAGLVRLQHGKQTQFLTAEAQATVLCSLFLTHFIHSWSEASKEKPLNDPILALFFQTGRARFDGPGQGSIAAGIHTWLARFHLARSEHAPVLRLDEGKGDDFELTLAVEHNQALMSEPIALASVLTDPDWSQTRYGVLQTVSLLAEFFPPLNAYVSSGANVPLPIHSDDLSDFLFDTLPVIRLLGIRSLLPKSLERLLRPRLSMQIQATPPDSGGFLTAGDVFNFDWRVAVGEHLLSREEFERLVVDATGVIRFKGSYVYLNPDEIEKLRAQLARSAEISSAELMRIALAGEYEGAGVGLDEVAQQILAEMRQTSDVPLPSSLQAQLRPYQARGYAWLYRNIRLGLGSVIADDMGLGKTVQVIALLQQLKAEGGLIQAKALVIVPTSLLTNWQKEIARFAPNLSVAVFHGAKRELNQKQAEQRPDLLLTTYGVARTESAALKTLAWRVLVVDEAQNIKNPKTAQTKAVKSIAAGSFIAMSGTPVENRLSEYWSILDFANRGLLGKLPQFIKEYAQPIQIHHDQQVTERFKRVTAPFLLRRLKSDKSIISDLPDKIEQDQYCALSSAQTALYQSVVEEGLAAIAGESNTFQRQGLILQMILALKQICNHPAQYLKSGDRNAQLSGKAERFLELIQDIHDSQGKVLVFTQFREMGELLSTWLHGRHGREPLFLHGGLSRAKRDAMVERFQNDRTERVFILSLKAGGTGLNLTTASSVIHYDLWWNPAVEAQATDRAYRIGQQQNVQVHRLITRATFEERINDMIQAKRQLADLTVGVGEQWIGNLAGDELKEIFSLG